MSGQVSVADFSEFLLFKLKKGEEGLYYRRIPDPARIGLLIVGSLFLFIAINAFLCGRYHGIDIMLQNALLLGIGLAILLAWWLVGYREILVTRDRMLITKISPGTKSFFEIPLSSIEEITLRSKSNFTLLLLAVIFTGPLVILLAALYWKSRRIIVRSNVEHSVPVRGRAARVIVADLIRVVDSLERGV